jgi:hypothetical protein
MAPFKILPFKGRGTATRWRGIPVSGNSPVTRIPLRQASPATSPLLGGY